MLLNVLSRHCKLVPPVTFLIASLLLPTTLLAQSSTTSATPAALADRLFKYAEASAYKTSFPAGAATQSASPFLYRYYPTTATYLGVASGNNPTYQDGVYVMGGSFGPAPMYVGKLTSFIPYDPQLAAAGGGYSMVVTSDGNLWGIGNNNYGQVGDGTTKLRTTFFLVATGVSSVVTAEATTYFLKKDGTLWGMGKNLPSFLTTVVNSFQSTPIKIANDVIAVSAEPGGVHTLFLKADKTLWGLGTNYGGELGTINLGGSQMVTTPVLIGSDVISFAAGDSSTFFIKSDRSLWAMGDNIGGQLGDGTTTRRTSPVQVATGVAAVASGTGYFTMFIKTDSATVKTPGTLWAMGLNTYGQLGDGTTTSRSTPVQVATGVQAVTAGQYTTHFIKIDDSLWAIGGNGSGQVGDGTKTDRKTPVQVATSVAYVNSGEFQTIFIKKDGTFWAMGDNNGSTLIGDGTFTDKISPTKMLVTGTAELP